MLCSWRMSVILPFMFTQLLAMMFFSGADEAGQHFDCYNDYDRFVFCQFRPPNNQTNCSEYTMSITPINNPERQSCGFKYEDGSTAECKCSLEYIWLAIHTQDHKATLLRGGQQLKSIVFNTIKSFKPNSPTITVNQAGMGNFKVTWDTHHRNPSIDDCLNAVVTYGKRNSPKIFQNVSSTHSFEMRELDPSSDYEVTVRTIYQNLSLLSDSSNQEEFTTPPSAHTRLKGLIVGLCIAVVIVSCTVLYCYPIYKAKYWDNIPKCYPNLLTMVPASEQMFLHPPQPIISNVYLDSTEKEDNDKDKQRCEVFTNDGNYQESCGTTSEPSLGCRFSDGNIIDNVHAALRQALPHLTITSSGTDYDMTSSNSDYGGNDLSLTPGALSFDNRSYNSSQNYIISGSSATQMQPESCGGPACHHSTEGDISIHICPDPNTLVGLVTSQQGLNIQLGSSPPIQTDLSYRPCHADSGSFSQQENASLALISNGTDECVPGDVSLRAEAGYESFSEAVSGGHNNIPPENTMLWNREEAQVCDDDGLSPVDMDYQAFPTM